MDKPALRAHYTELRAAFAGMAREQANDMIVQHALEAILPYAPACVGLYFPLRSEVDIAPLFALLAARHITTALPVVQSPEKPLIYREWKAGAPLVTTRFGVLEPAGNAPLITPDLLLVPLLAYDLDGYRLGYGGGHYDRTLASFRDQHGLKAAIGISYAVQLCRSLPREPHDAPLEAVVTELGLNTFAP